MKGRQQQLDKVYAEDLNVYTHLEERTMPLILKLLITALWLHSSLLCLQAIRVVGGGATQRKAQAKRSACKSTESQMSIVLVANNQNLILDPSLSTFDSYHEGCEGNEKNMSGLLNNAIMNWADAYPPSVKQLRESQLLRDSQTYRNKRVQSMIHRRL